MGPGGDWKVIMNSTTGRLRNYLPFALAAGVALTLMFPGDGHGQANAPKWLECFSPNECEVRVFNPGWHRRKGRVRLLAERAASACQAAGYSHYVAGTAIRVELHAIQRVYFTHDSALPARPCAFSATAELEAEAREMASVKGYPWPVTQVLGQSGDPGENKRGEALSLRWTFNAGENDWGEALPESDVILAPVVPALRSDQEDLRGVVFLGRDCAATLLVFHTGAGTGRQRLDRHGEPIEIPRPLTEAEDLWAYVWAYVEGAERLDEESEILLDGLSGSGDGFNAPDLRDRILEVRVDGTPVERQGRNVTNPTAGMVASSRQTLGAAVWSAEHDDNAAFEWTVTDRDRETIREHFPHCVESR